MQAHVRDVGAGELFTKRMLHNVDRELLLRRRIQSNVFKLFPGSDAQRRCCFVVTANGYRAERSLQRQYQSNLLWASFAQTLVSINPNSCRLGIVHVCVLLTIRRTVPCSNTSD